ncbi:MAG: extradiol dioxygenase, type [Pseudomonadota bacterium]|jgi:catechol 2,3-dioxygenase
MPIPKAHFRHVGVAAFDSDELAKFYTRWFGLVVSDIGAGIADGVRVVFMTGDPLEHHQIAFANLRQPGSPGMQQLSFVYDGLTELKQLAMDFAQAGVPILQQKDHGNTWSIYVADPEGNRIECYSPTPWYVRQPTWWPLDLITESVETIYERTRDKAKAQPGYMTREAWMAQTQARIDAARNAH